MTKTLTLKKAQEDLPLLLETSHKTRVRYLINVKGKKYALKINPLEEEYTSESETRELEQDKNLLKELEEAEKEIEAGNWVSWEDLKKELDL